MFKKKKKKQKEINRCVPRLELYIWTKKLTKKKVCCTRRNNNCWKTHTHTQRDSTVHSFTFTVNNNNNKKKAVENILFFFYENKQQQQ